MAQKTKVKELVGRGLDSYHTKALQQMDRIEKKNKEQNHKISILSNELDNDYLTKTEEGSVISLEHSKEGMVYLDELQGNTLVNYCTDGSKEMTLNGDIDVEGTFVTTTEGVDNGLVDVMCEGNTLVNIFSTNNYSHTTHAEIKNNITYNVTKNSIEVVFNKDCIGSEYMVLLIGDINTKHISMLKPNQKYTLCFDVEQNYDWTLDINCKKGNSADPLFIANRVKIKNGRNKITMTTLATLPTLTEQRMYLDVTDKTQRLAGRYLKISNLVLVENEEDNIIPYFEGMKSVGQDNENGHKIEISSSVGKENLIKDSDIYIEQSDTFKTFNSSYQNIIDKVQNKTITISVDIEVEDMIPRTDGRNRIGCELSVVYEDDTRGYHGIWYTGENFKGRQARTFSITKKIKTIDYFGIYIQCAGKKHKIGRPKIEIGDTNTNWCPSSNDNLNGLQTFMNKKEILLNEPLRSLPNGVCDKKVKIGNKWYIERNCGEVEVVSTMSISIWGGIPNTINNAFAIQTGIKNKNTDLSSIVFNCDKHIPRTRNYLPNNDVVGICDSQTQGNILIKLPATNLTEYSIDAFRTWLSNNPFKVVYQLETPTYEPLEIEPTLNTYNDITHISNNSIIPCNMKIQNTGYNAIIKPSTLYTVALDTNKSGTIGMNLGGAKGTTTNNVLKLTTPATLTDDSLRLYGKGIKGSKVRLLEGDRTNWIPSHFEGMKSSFEDKLQDDGSYKMEILSNNRNLFDVSNTSIVENNSFHNIELGVNNGIKLTSTQDNQGWQFSQLKLTCLKPNTTYTLRCNITKSNPNSKPAIRIFRMLDNSDYGIIFESGSFTFKTPKVGTKHLRLLIYTSIDNVPTNQGDVVYFKDIQISEVASEYVDNKYNKIQFSSIEPLRGKDRFVFVNGELVIERNNAEKILNGTENWMYDTASSSQEVGRFGFNNIGMKGNRSLVVCDKYAFKTNYTMASYNYEGIFTSVGGSTLFLDTLLNKLETKDLNGFKKWLSENPVKVVYELAEPTYEEVPFELQKIILEGYENGTLFIDTNIPPTSTITYAGETPIVKATKLNKTEVLNNTNDINDNIIPYLMDMDYRVVCLQLTTEEIEGGVSMARLFGGTYEMIKRDILSKRLSRQEYGYRLADYFNAGKLTEQEVRELEDLR